MSMLEPTARALAGPVPGILDLVGQSGPMGFLVLGTLTLMSIVCWGIIVERSRGMRLAEREDRALRERLESGASLAAASEFGRHLAHGPLAALFAAFHEEVARFEARGLLGPDARPASPNPGHLDPRVRAAVGRVLEKEAGAQARRFHRHLGFLATTATVAPFIGLFGTVWGIMNAFRSIGSAGVANLAAYAPGIAEALVATAAGLAAAIPAVAAYNYFVGRARRLEEELDDFSADLLLRLEQPPP